MNMLEEGQQLQWTKGDKIGTVEEISMHENEWTKFKSGSRIATSLINEFMIPIEGEPLDFNQVSEKPLIQNKVDTNLINANRSSKLNKNSNPIKILFDKQKKTENIELNLKFLINVPSSDIFDIINMSFDESEVTEELNSFILNQINETLLKDTLTKAVETLILEKYKS
jgi:hypothetical protein